MTYEEFWEKDYKLVESYKLRHDRKLDYDAMNLFKMYQYMYELLSLQMWSESDPKKRGKAPKITEKFEPISEYGKYQVKLEEEKQKEVQKYIDGIRGIKK